MLLGAHSYCFHLHNIDCYLSRNKFWERQMNTLELIDYASSIGLDGLQLGDAVFESHDPGYLKEVRAHADSKKMFLEYNFSLDIGNKKIGKEFDLTKNIEISSILGADIAKVGLDLVRPRPVMGTRFIPEVKSQLEKAIRLLKAGLPLLREKGIYLAIENHCDTYSEEILWVLDQLNDSHVGACIDTSNAMYVMEDPLVALNNLAPRAFTNHFRDDIILGRPWGFEYTGVAVGEGDVNMNLVYNIIRKKSSMRRIIIETAMKFPLAPEKKESTCSGEKRALLDSIEYCRNILGIEREEADGEKGLPTNIS